MPPTKHQRRFERFLHMAMGFVAGLLNLRLLLWVREFRQLPPENDRYPVLFVGFMGPEGQRPAASRTGSPHREHEYWAKARILDTLCDSRDYDRGAFVAWFVVAGGFFWLGRA